MTKRKYMDAEVIVALKQLEPGRNAADLGRGMGVSKHTVYAWEAQFNGPEVNQVQHLRRFEEERSRSSLGYQMPAQFAGQLAVVRLRPAPRESTAQHNPPRGDQYRIIHPADLGAGQSRQSPRHHARRHHLQCGSS